MEGVVQESSKLVGLDLALTEALQISPRASWSQIGRVVSVDPVTASRHFEALRRSGRAWITCYPALATTVVALVEIECEAGRADEVGLILASDPHAVTVEHVAGGRDIFLTVVTGSFSDLSRYLLDRLRHLPGIRASRSHPVTRSFTEGSAWRAGSLGPRQHQQLAAFCERDEAGGSLRVADLRRVSLALGADGRISATDLASLLGVSVNTARRRLAQTLGTKQLSLRCDVARACSAWPVSVIVWARVPSPALRGAGERVASLRETRMCFATASGPHNLVFALWVASLSKIQRVEEWLSREIPDLSILDHAVVLRATKLMGNILDASGRRVGLVPIDIWRDPVQPVAADRGSVTGSRR